MILLSCSSNVHSQNCEHCRHSYRNCFLRLRRFVFFCYLFFCFLKKKFFLFLQEILTVGISNSSFIFFIQVCLEQAFNSQDISEFSGGITELSVDSGDSALFQATSSIMLTGSQQDSKSIGLVLLIGEVVCSICSLINSSKDLSNLNEWAILKLVFPGMIDLLMHARSSKFVAIIGFVLTKISIIEKTLSKQDNSSEYNNNGEVDCYLGQLLETIISIFAHAFTSKSLNSIHSSSTKVAAAAAAAGKTNGINENVGSMFDVEFEFGHANYAGSLNSGDSYGSEIDNELLLGLSFALDLIVRSVGLKFLETVGCEKSGPQIESKAESDMKFLVNLRSRLVHLFANMSKLYLRSPLAVDAPRGESQLNHRGNQAQDYYRALEYLICPLASCYEFINLWRGFDSDLEGVNCQFWYSLSLVWLLQQQQQSNLPGAGGDGDMQNNLSQQRAFSSAEYKGNKMFFTARPRRDSTLTMNASMIVRGNLPTTGIFCREPCREYLISIAKNSQSLQISLSSHGIDELYEELMRSIVVTSAKCPSERDVPVDRLSTNLKTSFTAHSEKANSGEIGNSQLISHKRLSAALTTALIDVVSVSKLSMPSLFYGFAVLLLETLRFSMLPFRENVDYNQHFDICSMFHYLKRNPFDSSPEFSRQFAR